MEGLGVMVWGRFVSEHLNACLTGQDRLAGAIHYVLTKPPMEPFSPGSGEPMPVAEEGGHFEGGWDHPVTMAEFRDILSDVIRIADGQEPITAQANWAWQIVGCTNYWRETPVEGTTYFAPWIEVPYQDPWTFPVKWGEWAQIIKAFAIAGTDKSNPQHQWGEHLVALVKALQPSAEALRIEVPDEPAAPTAPRRTLWQKFQSWYSGFGWK